MPEPDKTVAVKLVADIVVPDRSPLSEPPEIGRKFSGKDHTTVLHGVKKIQKMISTDSEISKDVRLLTKALQ